MRIVVTGGGTGGHVFPAIAVAQAFDLSDVMYAGSPRGLERKLTSQLNIPFISISSRPLVGRGFWGKVSGLLYLGVGFIQAMRLLRGFKPNLVVATGGYVSAPVLAAAIAFKTPSFLLEQNLLPGRTTRFFSKFVSKLLVSFEESKRYLHSRTNVVVTGTPVRETIGKLSKSEACATLGLSVERPVISVIGASQGARSINQVVLESLPLLRDKTWQIVHITGQSHYDTVAKQSKQETSGNLKYLAIPFTEEIAAVYAASDLILSRAGATSIAEITLCGKPSILIPYPYAADNHQELNARWLEEKGGCRVLLESQLNSHSFCETLESLMGDSNKLSGMGAKARGVSHPDALQRILEVMKELA